MEWSETEVWQSQVLIKPATTENLCPCYEHYKLQHAFMLLTISWIVQAHAAKPNINLDRPNSGRARLQRRCMGGGQNYGKVSVVATCAACSVHYGSISKLTDYFYNFRTKYLSCHHCLVLWILMVYYRLLRHQIWRAWSKHSTLGKLIFQELDEI